MKSSEVSCPQCKSNSYINPGLKIFVSPCYHSLCEMCVSRLFASGPNKCPECGVTLRRSNYTSQTFEDVSVERECRVRKIVSSHLGRTLDDFSDEEDYNEHLEKIEDIVEELMVLNGPREITNRLQEIKEQLGIASFKPATESVKRRKTEETTPEIHEQYTPPKQPQYLFPPTAVDLDTIPDNAFTLKTLAYKSHYKDLINIMIRKAAASLLSSEL
ncbi:CDK-activating kinase assembly factor MAT1 [Nematocida homosporus]|uniref:CDK-activating kinase assembly factor MAT1 n=1 Tax=Nematocida homosporus TaxID=1912981 RepID=UPI00221EE80C|nr:CDK-activating kinase assembly factor MAT1 [Nematocida homosporus]KAI5184604.1 CDK-activating kinase assembly factor MAT1 [Nematocida homosporus]